MDEKKDTKIKKSGRKKGSIIKKYQKLNKELCNKIIDDILNMTETNKELVKRYNVSSTTIKKIKDTLTKQTFINIPLDNKRMKLIVPKDIPSLVESCMMDKGYINNTSQNFTSSE